MTLSAMLLITCSASLACADETEQERIASYETVETLKQSPESRMPRRDPAAMTLGIVLTSLGGLSLLAGVLLAIDNSPGRQAPAYDNGSAGLPLALGIGGGLALVGGVPLIVFGAQRRPSAAMFAASAGAPAPWTVEARWSF